MIWQIVKIVIGILLGCLAVGLAPMWPMLAMIGDAPGSEGKALWVLGIAAGVILAIGAAGLLFLGSGIRGLL